MPRAGVTEGRSQIANMQDFFNLLFGYGNYYGGQAGGFLQQFLGQTGLFANPLFGAGGVETLLGELGGFRQGVGEQLRQFEMPAQIWEYLDQLGFGTDRIREILGTQGATAKSQYLRDRLNEMVEGRAPGMAPVRETAQEMLGLRGYTAPLQEIQKFAQNMIATQGFTPQIRELEQAGLDVLKTGGRTADTAQAVQEFQKILAAGGYTPGTTALSQAGQQLLASQGMTPELRQLMGTAVGGLQTGGWSPQAQQILDAYLPIMQSGGQGGALLPMDQVISMARDQAATAAAQQAQAARRSALQRVGPALAAGPAEGVMAEFADQAMQAEAAAMREAMLGQQGLQLQQFLGAGGIGADLSKTAAGALGAYAGLGGDVARALAANLGTGGQLLGTAEDVAMRRLGIGAEGLTSTLNTEVQRAIAAGDWVKAANVLASARLGLGTEAGLGAEEMAGTFRRDASTALTGLADIQRLAATAGVGLTGAEFQREAGALGLIPLLATSGANIYTGQQDLAFRQAAAEIQAILQSYGLSGDLSSAFTNQWLTGAGALGGIGGQYLGVLPSLGSALGNLGSATIGAAAQPAWWQNLLTGLVGGLGQGLGTGIGDWISAPRTPGTAGGGR